MNTNIPTNKQSPTGTVLVFSSHAHIVPFVVTECCVADAIAPSAPVAIVRPFPCTCGYSPYWTVKTKTNACPTCAERLRLLKLATPKFKHITLSEYSQSSDLDLVINNIDSQSKCAPENIAFQSYSIGKRALHDIILKHKIDTFDWNNNKLVTQDFNHLLIASSLVILWLERLLTDIKCLSFCVYNYPYSINQVACSVADKCNVQFYSLTNGPSLRHVWDTLVIARGTSINFWKTSADKWRKHYAARVLNSRQIEFVADHFDELLLGRMAHAYSAPLGERQDLALIDKATLSGKRRLLVAATSSPDERLAAEKSGVRQETVGSDLFESHLDWLSFLIDKCGERKDLSLIVRVHPREFPNKRERIKSSHAAKLESLLSKLPPNVVVNWPEDNISIYSLILRADLLLTCWSSVGLEASAFGCPVVLPRNPIASYSHVADAVCSSESDYWQNIESYLNKEWSLQRAITTFRWLWLIQYGNCASLKGRSIRRPELVERINWLRNQSMDKMKNYGLPVGGRRERQCQLGAEMYSSVSKRPVSLLGAQMINLILRGQLDPGSCLTNPSAGETELRGKQASPLRQAESEERRRIAEVIKKLISRIERASADYPLGPKTKSLLENLDDVVKASQ